jgi:hypothetical protein
MQLIGGFEKHFRTVLGLNESESLQIAKVLGLKRAPKEALAELACKIREKLKISLVVIHPREYAVWRDRSAPSR